ncbi:MAG: hypothetical protein IOD12_00940 [Silvanigrellales bacterium]|nr:hypothetical protein [Silvanigrellales bacterium]
MTSAKFSSFASAAMATLALALVAATSSACIKRDNTAANTADDQAKALRENAEKQADATEKNADKQAEAVREAAETRADTIEAQAATSAESTRNAAEALADAIEKCPVMGVNGSKKYYTTTSSNVPMANMRPGMFSCFSSEDDAKSAGFLASAETGTRAE